jgi:hypothetical protein
LHRNKKDIFISLKKIHTTNMEYVVPTPKPHDSSNFMWERAQEILGHAMALPGPLYTTEWLR